MTYVDPSWCARIHAHRQPAEPATPPVPTPPAHGSPFRPRETPKEHVCECCGARMYDHNCKIVCPNCGYRRDCSDP